MTILALEFSSSRRSVAVARDGNVLAEASEQTETRGTNAFGLIEKVLTGAKIEREEISVIAVGLGPGSYTGIRAAVSIAQGWQLARGIKLIGVSSVEAIVAQAHAEKIFGRVSVVIDAQRNEFYLATFEILTGKWREIEPLKIVSAAEIQSRADAGEILIGPGTGKPFSNYRAIFPGAAATAKLAAEKTNFDDGVLEPIYLRETNFVKASAHGKSV
ncbi:MAG TPA: tRNA (adenosine(37)-N6)-threonylcarbamoyltransferase complex dimerization subunit type 1 TsaB [Verrucomicrobiae bacterium]|nr:tRNA (adenosine(37)-N6)-threonylcarbamoyltransferase complex dimerization subunit type 1 TsaB [Verrucomicrobiae bacterium]